MNDHSTDERQDDASRERRGFLGKFTAGFMLGGFLAGYGVFAAHATRFLFPSRRGSTMWQFVATLDRLRLGESMTYTTPGGADIVVARQAEGDSADAFVALSSVCPHLGCAVHWEPQNDRFFCPCHNGAFDAAGKATEGPPFKAKQELTKFPLKVENGLLYVEVPTTVVGPKEVTS